jgi:hypothetical protein
LSPERQRELERREAAHLAEFNEARPLTMRDMIERIITEEGPLPVAQLLARPSHPNVIREFGVRRTDRELIQIVYEKGRGSRLYRWLLE